MLWKFSIMFGLSVIIALLLFAGFAYANGGSPRLEGEKTLKEQIREREKAKKTEVKKEETKKEEAKEETKVITEEKPVKEEKPVQEDKKEKKVILFSCRARSTIVTHHYEGTFFDSGIRGASGAGIHSGGNRLNPEVTQTIKTCN